MPEFSRALARSPAERSAAAKPLNRACKCAALGQSCARCGSAVQRRSLDGSQEPVADIPESVRQTVSRPGRTLDSGVREDMEQHFGTNFGHVRVHTDSDAARSAGDVRAAAYAFGDNLVFNQGYYRPDSRFGRQLLAHELTHVLQQGRGGGNSQPIGPAHEQEADRAAQALNNPRASFGVRQASTVGIGPLTFAELQKKAWGYVPDVAKPYVAPLALEVKEQAEKIVSADTEVPPAVVTVIEDPVAAAKQATVKLAAEAKVKARDYSMQQAGRLKGVVMEGTSIVDTLVWTAHMSAQAHGLVDAKSKAPEISGTVAKAIDDVAQAGEKRVFGNLPPEQALVFNSYETGELEGAIGSQVALSFVGVEEVQLALKALGVLGSVRGLMQMLEKHGVSGWYKNPEFIGALVGVGLSFLSLKSTKAAHKITRIVVNTALASGSLISAGPAVWKLYNDWKQIPESDPKRNETLKADLGALVKLVVNIVVDILRHQSNKKGGANETTPAHPEAEPPPSGTKTALAEPAVAPSTEVVKPGAAPLHETPVAGAPKALGTSPAPVETTARTVKPEAPVDVGLANRGVRPEPGTRAMAKREWKAQESASRRAKRIDEAIARVEADAKPAAAEAVAPVAKPAAPEEAPRVTRQETPTEPTATTKPAVKPAEEPAPSKETTTGKAADADAESTVTSVKKSDAEAVKATVNDHEVVITRDGVGVCSPPPCLVIHLAYAKELANHPELKEAYKQVETTRKTDPDRAAELGALLVRNLEMVRGNAAAKHGNKGTTDVQDVFDELTEGTGRGKSPSNPDEVSSPKLPSREERSTGRSRTKDAEEYEGMPNAERPRPAIAHPENLEAGRTAGLPDEVLHSGTVLTGVDFADVVPDKPLSRARQAPDLPQPADERKRGIAGRRPTSAPDARDVQHTELAGDISLTIAHIEAAGGVVTEVAINRRQRTGPGDAPETASTRTRPDLQLAVVNAEMNGRRILIEYDRAPGTRAMEHAREILMRDPNAIVIVKIVGFERAAR